MPNTRVQLKSALIAGIIAGTSYQVVQLIYIYFQVGVAKYGAIYGSFAALPLFLIWLQLSWLILLFGAEVSFAEQNVETYEFEADCLKVSHSFRELLSLNIVHLCVKKFRQAERALSADEISHEREIPVRLVRQILYELVEARVLSEVKLDDTETMAYHPARDIEDLTIMNVLNQLNRRGVNWIPLDNTGDLEKLKGRLMQFQEGIEKSPANVPLKDI